MKYLILSILTCFAAGAAVPFQPQTVELKDNTVYVNPMIGTQKMGHTFPGACAPHGFVQLSPDTDTVPHNIGGVYQPEAYRYCAGYQYDDPTIVGFSHTHLSGTGHSDLGDVLLMPVTGEPELNPGVADRPETGYRSRFNHETETARPGYYEVTLADYDVKVRLTATERVGIHRYTYPAGKRRNVILDLAHGIYNYDGKTLWANVRVENDTLLTGYRITNGWARVNYTFFAITFSSPIRNYGFIDKKKPDYVGFWRKFPKQNFPEMGGRQVVAWFEFDSDEAADLEVRVALSAVGTEGALKNLLAETDGKSFDDVRLETAAKWAKELACADVEGDDEKKTMFYTSLYHTLINPSVYMDVDGQYRGIDHQIHKAEGFTNYTVFSVWDTYRALHPLFNLLNRRRSADIVASMMAHWRQSVHRMLPVWSHNGNENWCMTGYHSVSVLADAITKEIKLSDADRSQALEAMQTTSNTPYFGGTADYVRLGYVPFDVSADGASTTLEYAYDDWTVYHTAAALGNDSVADVYKKRALNYRNVFDPSSGFVRAKMKDGTWKKDFNLLSTHGQGFIEGNSWNYSFYVPHDVNGLIREMGGEKVFIRRLDSLFTMELPEEFFAETEDVTKEGIMGNYVHGNEPSHHIAYLYAWTSQPWKTQFWVREIMNRMYRSGIDGLCGNDDCGQMSAWYIFSAMGFYPVCPGSDEFVLGAPYFPFMKLNLENGKTITVKAPKASDTNRYVKAVYLNGKRYDKGYITYSDLKDGAELLFEMSSSPNRKRVYVGTGKPYSISE